MTQTVLIIGATRGIGAELATRYAANGDRVIATKRSEAPKIDGVTWLTLDTTDAPSIKALAADLPTDAIDLLIVNAGVYLDKGHQIETGFDPEIWSDTFAANVTGPFLVVQALLPLLKAGGARVALMSSRMGSNANASGGSYVYRSSKAAITNLASNLACDLAADGISFGAYHPGWVRTDMGGGNADIDVATSAKGLMARFEALSPLRSGCFETYDGTELGF